jgi:hypothetical protein
MGRRRPTSPSLCSCFRDSWCHYSSFHSRLRNSRDGVKGFCVDGVKAGAGIPLFSSSFLFFLPCERGFLCVESNMYGRSFVFPTMCLCPLPNDGWSTRFVAM